ncbi:MAG: prephenate dehydrogenase [Candidatus Omnitrophica bacterium]|nr:prephenate dehydrogenase [Candidatus Omnitrophota bacterium]
MKGFKMKQEKKQFSKVVIIGMGLIGGSIGKALLEKRIALEVVGVFRRKISLEKAIKEKSLSGGYVDDYNEALKGAELIIIATPVNTIMRVLERLSKEVKDREVIVTDVGSTKKEIVDYARQFRSKFIFIGAHPIAGSERTGVEYSKSGLFTGSICVLTRDRYIPRKAFARLKSLWTALGAKVDIISPHQHDRFLAFTSHLPHAVAYALAGSESPDMAKYMATGFRDTARIASSDPSLWADIFLSNRGNLLKAIKVYRERLGLIEKFVRRVDREGLRKTLKSCKGVMDAVRKED